LTDKRGSGRSTGDWRTAGFEELAADALAGVRFLHSQDRIDPDRIGLVGLSQGGRVVPVAAALSDEVKFAVNVVGDAVSFGEQSFHELLNMARRAGLDANDTRELIELNRAAGHYVLTGNWQPFSERLQAGMSRPWRRIAAGFPPTRDAPIWTFLRKAATFDPMPYWVLVRQPVPVLYGEEDETDKVAVAESRRRLEFGFRQSGKDNFEIAILPGLGHALTDASGGALHTHAARVLDAWIRREVKASHSVSP
jgi:pimeloyl-ACP methyl ester carboxylesterase